MFKILGLSGSPRAGGNTDTLLEQFLKGAKEAGSEVELLFLRNYRINYCIGCEQCRRDKTCTRFDDAMRLLYPKIEESQGLIIGSPAHNYNITAITKAFIDRLYPYYDFTGGKPREWSSRLAEQNRKAIVFTVGEQKSIHDMRLALPAMALPLQALGYVVARQVSFRGFFAKNDISASKKSLLRAHDAGARLGALILSG